jgi:hypothetical protein
MSLNIKALAITGAVVWGGAFLLIGLANLMFSGYGTVFLDLGASIYPGYDGPGGFGSVIVATLYAIVDGAVGGAVLAWVYNMVAAKSAAVG